MDYFVNWLGGTIVHSALSIIVWQMLLLKNTGLSENNNCFTKVWKYFTIWNTLEILWKTMRVYMNGLFCQLTGRDYRSLQNGLGRIFGTLQKGKGLIISKSHCKFAFQFLVPGVSRSPCEVHVKSMWSQCCQFPIVKSIPSLFHVVNFIKSSFW